MRAITVQKGEPSRFVLGDRPEPRPGAEDVLIDVAAFSLNHGDVHTARAAADPGAPLGWDVAGTVARAPDGSGFAPGDRVC